jgi:uncharacterized membrane protein
MFRTKTLFYVQAALIAALYALTTFMLWEFSSLAIQVRLSEIMCILPAFTAAAIPGLTFGCAFANLIAGNVIDAVFGSLATLVAAMLTYLISKHIKNARLRLFLLPLPAVLCNALAVPLILYYGYGMHSFLGATHALPVLMLYAVSVCIGQAIVCYGGGIPLYGALKKISTKYKIF